MENNIDQNTKDDLSTTGKASLSPEPDPVSECCAAPLYLATMKIGSDGLYSPSGTLMNVKKCMACDDIVLYLDEAGTDGTKHALSWTPKKQFDSEIERGIPAEKIWLLTEANRTMTTVLTPDEY